ncbi:hypothetical protein EGW08_009335, partial [Elysia chlorotica]
MGGKATQCCKTGSFQKGHPNPVTGLTKNDVRLLRDSWKQMEHQRLILPIGRDNFISLFESYPHLLMFFETFSLKEQKPPSNQKLCAHALVFMKALRLYLDYIDEPDVEVGLLHTMSLSHLQRLISSQDVEV